MAFISGDEYVNRINQLKSEVWAGGRKVDGNISEHPFFHGVMKSQAELYDLQTDPQLKGVMVHKDKNLQQEIGTSYLIPRSQNDLKKRREMIQVWARHTAGLMGRSPDYMNTVLAAFASSVHLLKGQKNCFPENLFNFYKFAAENDLTFTHTFINPQKNRSSLACFDENSTNAHIVERISEGIIVKGAKLLATQGGITDEIIVFSAPGAMDASQAFAFSIPSNTKGLKFVCRRSFLGNGSANDSPLSSRFEEQDSVVIFDNVLVPWERVFFYDNIKVTDEFYIKSNFVPFTLHQIVTRQVVKTEFILGIAQTIVETINISEYQHVQSKVAEIIKGLECEKALLIQSEVQAKPDQHGVMVPDRFPLYVAVNLFQENYPRFAEIIQQLGASGMVNLPDEAQFQSVLGKDLEYYLQGFEVNGHERVKIFRLAHDLCMSSFGSRQTLYERFFFGDPIRLSQIIYQTYPLDKHVNMVKKFI
ncbi:4-hydroxyphenylacetate 3-monooxygenase, oxygenase component [Thalassobacillus pellis]|uniref:4-hydroxyphenylacetate 3-monooxygenase, oxygenase component n=1 Tax=Thalassobacillus pellis TaxID=748008 RepID=UPI0019605BF4|nr:4-hydroxyphenylacetate 3-monooxygenase, oxygenase component [Thalassobacillus pellis]MBM7553580.1 4-hydroxyphenylacetate 3-monooxygenase [Thalassobacillus pellis]